ncbi:MAG: hypothetical protein HY062_04255 [Bacteroidetes bacterium]|nr:hypothetical protein [Bacteroidota bacterium]
MKQFFCSDTFKSLSIFIALGIMFGSCKHKTKFEELLPVSYSTSIAPIISSNCAFSGCHGDSAFQKFSLTSYDALMNGGISAGSPEKSKIYSVIKSLDKDKIMPKQPYAELSEKQIQLIYIWIGQGAKNN